MPEAGSHTAAVVTVSDGVAKGVRQDRSGEAVAAALEAAGIPVVRRDVVADERPDIGRLLTELSDAGVSLVVTTGGTGLGRRDVTPEATRDVVDREVPGLAEAMRAAGRDETPFADLSRGIVGARGSTLVVNLPGSEAGATESLRAILTAIPHALELVAGRTVHGPGDHTHDHIASHGAEHEEQAHGRGRVVATAVKVHGSPPCRVGNRLVIGPAGPVEGTLGCAEFDAAAVADAPGVSVAATPTTRTYTHELGSVEVYLEPEVALPTLLVFSATPVATHLVRWAREVGFEPIVIESRHDRDGPPGAPLHRSLDVSDVNEQTYAVHTDHDAPGVAESLAALLRSPAPFVGAMGSARHVGPYVERLRQMGFTDDDLARIRTPLGLDIGARSAEEIALSILAGVVAARHGANGGWLDRRGD
jgi:molybdopterin adenylyltransferase